jgi:tetratricopeptide (TPR) repeat protein/TolB-like protein
MTGMADPRWSERLSELFERALEVPPELRDDLLRQECGRDAAMLAELLSLLAAHDRAPNALERMAATLLPPRSAAHDAPAGRIVSHYRIEERIGSGGGGAVYRAWDLVLGRPLALKFLRTDVGVDVRTRERIEAEARAASALDHPNIGVVYEVGDAGSGEFFIAMAYYDGETVAEKLRRGRLPFDEALSYAVQAAAGLARMHAAGLVHRDIKPGNLVVTDAGELKIVDFGLAAAVGADEGSGLTRGTVGYMSPEQTDGSMPGAGADVWSLGVLLHEMLTGERPFVGKTAREVIDAIRHGEPAPLARAAAPRALRRIVAKCLQKDPALRPPHAGELLRELQAVQLQHSSGGRPLVRYSRVAAAAMAAVMLVAAVGRFATNRLEGLAEENRVVVAPFENRTGNVAHDVVGSMATDWIIQGLAAAGGALVVPYSATLASARHAREETRSSGPARLRRLARETGAALVVSGAYYAQHDSLLFQVRITRAAGGVVEALPPIAAHAAAPAAGLGILRQRVLAGLAPHLDARVREYTAVVGRTPSIEAWREYARGQDLYFGDADSGDWRQALVHFAAAARLDSTFILPLVRSALIHSQTSNFAAADSLAGIIAPHLGGLPEYERLSMNVVTSVLRGDYAASYRSAARLAELAPNTLAHWQLARELLALNRPAEALRVYAKLDPHRGELRGWSLYWIKLAEAHHLVGDYRAELRAAREMRRLFPATGNAVRLELRALAALGRVRELTRVLDDHLAAPLDGPLWTGQLLLSTSGELRAHGHDEAAARLIERSVAFHEALPDTGRAGNFRQELGEALYAAGRWGEAERFITARAAGRPRHWQLQARLGTLAAQQGRRDEAERIAASLARLDQPWLLGENTYWRARIAARLGDREEALQLLRAAYAEGRRWWLDLHIEPDFDSIRDEPSFRELLRPKG